MKNIITSTVVAATVLFYFSTGVTLASPSESLNPSTITLKSNFPAGSIVSLSDTYNITGGDKLLWTHTGVDFISDNKSKVLPVRSTVVFPDKTPKYMLSYIIEDKTKDNGYHLVDVEQVGGWVNLLGGNSRYVEINAATTRTTLMNQFTLKKWDVYWMPKVVAANGASLDYIESASRFHVVNPDGKTATPTFKITPTPKPRGTVTLNKTTFTKGEKVQIATVAEVFAAATNWHYEAVEVVGSNGYSKFLPLVTEKDGTAPAANGHNFPLWGEKAGALQFVYGGGSASPTTPNVYKEHATLDTSSLPPGEYEVKYTLFDAVGRASSNSSDGNGTTSTKFTLLPASGTSPTLPPADQSQPQVPGAPGGNNPAPATPPTKDSIGKVINQQFGRPTPIMLNHTGTVSWKATNNGDKEVKTTLTARIETFINQPYEYTYRSGTRRVEVGKDKDGEPLFDYEDVYTTVTRYRVLPMTGTETKTFSIPAKGSVTWDIGKGMTMQIQGGNPSSFSGLGVGGPWVPNGGSIPGTGQPDTKENNNGYVAQSSTVGVNDGRTWLPILTVTAEDSWHYLSPTIKTQIPTLALKEPVKHDPVVTK